MKKGVIIVGIIILTTILLIVWMQIDTNSIVELTRAAITNPEPHEFNAEHYNTDIFAHFNLARRNDYDEYPIIEADVKRIFAIHNFFDGYIWIRYSCQMVNEDRVRGSGSARIPVKMQIHKENGEWKVIRIWEAP